VLAVYILFVIFTEKHIYRNIVNMYMNEKELVLENLNRDIVMNVTVTIGQIGKKYTETMAFIEYTHPSPSIKTILQIANDLEKFGVPKQSIKISSNNDRVVISATLFINKISAFGMDLLSLVTEIEEKVCRPTMISFRINVGYENVLDIRYRLDLADLGELERIPMLIRIVKSFAEKYGKKINIYRDFENDTIRFCIRI